MQHEQQGGSVELPVLVLDRRSIFVARREDALVVDRFALQSEEVGDFLDLFFAHERALHAARLVGAIQLHEHVSLHDGWLRKLCVDLTEGTVRRIGDGFFADGP